LATAASTIVATATRIAAARATIQSRTAVGSHILEPPLPSHKSVHCLGATLIAVDQRTQNATGRRSEVKIKKATQKGLDAILGW
jgi:hypothetical protein